MSQSALDELKKFTKVVADTGDLNSIKQFKPIDATTNPSILMSTVSDPDYEELVIDAASYGFLQEGSFAQQIKAAANKLTVNVGIEILKIIPGRVSSEVDSRLSFDTEGTIEAALKLISLYEEAGVSKDRVLIKIASTWEGIKAAEILEREHGIHCNMTLIFNFHQAVACAQANVTLISPFVGRIFDWYVVHSNDTFTTENDPGVLSVTKIYNYYKKFGHNTSVMGASFRNINQVKALAGCDLLTISPVLLKELSGDETPLVKKLDPKTAAGSDLEILDKVTEQNFRWFLNEDEMATDKLAEGIRKFSVDSRKIDKIVATAIHNLRNKKKVGM